MFIVYVLFIVVLANLIVGTLIGISGIAGFLLPMIYVGVLNMPIRDAFALSFISFFVGGIIGSYSYWKLGNIDIKFAKLLSIGSIFGAILGVKLNMIISVEIAKIFLYLVVLLSGISILMKKVNNDGGKKSININLLDNKVFVIFIGFLTAAICSLSGAGGPILVVPILTILGMDLKVAVGVAILNQIVIALPSAIGYLSNSDFKSMVMLILVSLTAHVIGIIFGAKTSNKINIGILRKAVSIISISSAVYMLSLSLI